MCRSVCAHECPNVSGAKSLETWVGPSGDLRDVCMAPESFLHLRQGIVTWDHHGDRMHVWDPTWSLGRVKWAFQVCAGGGHAAVADSEIPPALTTCFHFQPAGSLAFLVCLVPVLCS